MTPEDLYKVEHIFLLHLDSVKLASPARDISKVESQLNLIARIKAAGRASTEQERDELAAHPEAATIIAMVEAEAEARQRK